MNLGGFSWKRLLGISAFKSRVSRAIGIPLTASGRRRKLGASVFNAIGPVAGTLAVAAVAAAKAGEKSGEKAIQLEPHSRKGVHLCLVKGVTHSNDDGTSRAAAQQLCSIGDSVILDPDPDNEHDRHAIRVLLQTGQQIGYISATQASRFEGKVPLLTATVYSRAQDEWGNNTIKLRVVNSAEQQAYNPYLSSANSQSRSGEPISDVQLLQTEAREESKKQGWNPAFTLIYFENAEKGLYQIVLAENSEHIRQTLREGLVRVGFIGGNDVSNGIQFKFALDDSFPTDGIVAKRFLAHAREWVVSRAKDICSQKGIAAPIVHDLEPVKQFANPQLEGVAQNAPPFKSRIPPFKFGFVLGIAGLFLFLFTGEWRVTLGIVLIAIVAYGLLSSRSS